jgi:hypothetical protein
MGDINLSRRQRDEKRSSWGPNIRMMVPTAFMIGLVVLLAAMQYALAATSP